jgi:hypothetical protein
LLALVITAPLAAPQYAHGAVTLAILVVVICLGTWAMWRNPTVRFAAIALGVPTVAAGIIDAIDPDSVATRVLLFFGVLFFGLAIVRVFVRVADLKTVTEDSLYGAGSVYLMIGLGYSFAYYTIWKYAPNAFYTALTSAAGRLSGWPDFVYFSFTTLATVGYGDITPVGPLVRSVAVLEIITGVFFTAVIIARLVSLYRR